MIEKAEQAEEKKLLRTAQEENTHGKTILNIRKQKKKITMTLIPLSTRATLRTTMGITVEGTTAIDTTRTTTVPMGTTIRSTITVIEIITTRTSPLS